MCIIWVKVFKNGLSKLFLRLPSTNFALSILEYLDPQIVQSIFLTHASLMFLSTPFPWKHRKTKYFLMFFEIKGVNLEEIISIFDEVSSLVLSRNRFMFRSFRLQTDRTLSFQKLLIAKNFISLQVLYKFAYTESCKKVFTPAMNE